MEDYSRIHGDNFEEVKKILVTHISNWKLLEQRIDNSNEPVISAYTTSATNNESHVIHTINSVPPPSDVVLFHLNTGYRSQQICR
jgi:hypothetical protein